MIPKIKKSICLFCVTSSKSGIGDGFLSFINYLDNKENIFIAKGGCYDKNEFFIDSEKIIELRFSKEKPISYFNIYEWKRLASLLKRKSIDNIFFYSTAPINIFVARLLPEVHYSLWCHDPIRHPGEPWYLAFPKEIDLRLLMKNRRCERIFVSSNYLKKLLVDKKKIPHHKIVCLPLPWMDEIVRQGKRIDYDLRSYDFIVWGRIEAYKGLDVFGDALRILSAEGRTFKALIVGKGPVRRYLSDDILKDPNIKVKNRYVGNEELAGDICQSRIAVFPYTSSTGTHNVQTSLALGCRIVASDVGSFKELLTHDGELYGRLVPPGDPVRLADALRDLMANENHDIPSADTILKIYRPDTWARDIVKEIIAR